MVLQCLILISIELHKFGPVIRMDRSENIFWLYEYYSIQHLLLDIYGFDNVSKTFKTLCLLNGGSV